MELLTVPFLCMCQYIDETRDILDTELTGLVGESYNRAYGVMVNIQLLSEMEEICRCLASPERKPQLKKIWWDRLLVRDWIPPLYIGQVGQVAGKGPDTTSVFWPHSLFSS